MVRVGGEDDRRGHWAHPADIQDSRGHELDMFGEGLLVGLQLRAEGDDRHWIKDGGVNKPAQARVKITSKGNVFLHCALAEMGQGGSALCQIVAEALDTDPALGRIRPASTGSAWGLQPTQIALAISTGFFGQLVGALAVGVVAQRLRRLRVGALRVLICSLDSLAAAFPPSFVFFLVVRFIVDSVNTLFLPLRSIS
jgi:hypothetical protein